MLRWTSCLVAAAVLSLFAFLLITGDYVREGPVVASITEQHGVHLGDLFIAAGWAVGMAAVVVAAVSGGNRRPWRTASTGRAGGAGRARPPIR